jgi:predicted TIM-barrel fold metal-dependent hydrolase
MDAEGVAAEILFAGHTMATPLWFGEENLRAYPPDLRQAGCQAHHRWLAEAMLQGKGRFAGIGDPGPCLDLSTTVRELEWIAAHGFVGVSVPGILSDPALPPLYDQYYEPFWSAANELGLRLHVHAGYGIVQGTFLEGRNRPGLENDPGTEAPADSTTMVSMTGLEKRMKFLVRPRRVFWQLLLGRVFDRFPGLRLVFTEIRADWVPGLLRYLDDRLDEEQVRLQLRPSEYFATHCMVTPSAVRGHEITMRHEIGMKNMMFGVDFPHPESTWPNTRDWIRATFAGVPPDEASAILGENALAFYGFDATTVRVAAQKVGPYIDEVLGSGHPVDPRMIAHFDQRSGFCSSPDDPVAGLDTLLSEDLAVVRSEKG